jgi:signal transduction histidine kinase
MNRSFDRLSLSRKILLGIVPLFLIFVAASVAIHNHFQEQEMLEAAQDAARTYAEIIRESLVTMMINDERVDESFMERVYRLEKFDSLHLLVNELHLRPGLADEASKGRIETRSHTFHPHDSLEMRVLADGEPRFVRNSRKFRAVIPFTAVAKCRKCHEVPSGYVLGAVDLHIPLSRIAEAVSGNWRRSLMIFLGFSVLAIAVATVMYRRYVSRPIEGLIHAAEAIGRGDLAASSGITRPPDAEPGDSRDELLYLAHRFDEMRASLAEKIGQLDEVNRSLSDRNEEVEEALARLRIAQEELVRNERLAVMGKMTAQLSHEINNPVHNIRSLLESGVRKIDPESPARELVTVALDEVNRMAKLTRQMLDFYRGSVVQIEKNPLDMRSLIADLIRTNEGTLAQTNVRVALDAPAEVPAVLGSVDKLKQVFLNLLLNARDAMPQGGTITISLSTEQGDLVTRVADTGSGIPPEHIDRVFDAFFTTKQEVSGVGLGLAVSYGIIRQHGGTISVESEQGRGAVFTVRLPIQGGYDGA